jgi:fucose permease
MAGGVISGFLVSLNVPASGQLIVEAVLIFVALIVASRPMLTGDHGHRDAAFVRPSGALLALAVVTFCAVTAEGSMFDWSGVYLHRVLAAPDSTAAFGAAVFAAAMAVGRLVGDHFTTRFGPPALARGCALLAGSGMVAVILAPTPTAVFGGLVAVGLGLSIVVPIAFGAAGRAPGMAPGAAIAAVATLGYFGFLAAPPTIGFVAERVTLRGAFGLLLLLLLFIVVLAPATGKRQSDWGSLKEPRLGTGADGGGTTGPISPSGASSRSTITGA